MNFELPPLFVHIPLFIVNIKFDFQVYLFSNGRGMTKCQFLHDNTKATEIPRDFYENSRANKMTLPVTFSGSIAPK